MLGHPTVIRHHIAGRPLPRIEDAVKIGEVMRLAALSKLGWDTDDAIGRRLPRAPWQVSGRVRPDCYPESARRGTPTRSPRTSPLLKSCSTTTVNSLTPAEPFGLITPHPFSTSNPTTFLFSLLNSTPTRNTSASPLRYFAA